MSHTAENVASDFLELSSEQRMEILLKLSEKKSAIGIMAKELDATVPEVYRNFERLVKAELIIKNPDGTYQLTTYGKTVCAQVPSILFISKNKKYFKTHDFGDMPIKFLQRIGGLAEGTHVKGIVKVMEYCKDIYENANEYLYNILVDVSYDTDIIETLSKKLKNNVKVNSIFSESAILPKVRKKILEKVDFKKFVEKGILERKMQKDVKIVVVLNEKEACVMFPIINGDVDMSETFYSSDVEFHDWCLDYFMDSWRNSGVFQESKFKE